MPYITNNRKTIIDPELEGLIALVENNKKEGYFHVDAGDLNFIFTRIILAYWKHRKRYQAINDICGALNNAYDEFYRRVVKPYEKKKIKENGDVYNYL